MLFGVFGPWLILVHGTCELTRVIPLFVLDWEAWTFKLMHRVGQSLKPHALTLSIKWTEKETQAGSQNVNEEWGGVNFLVQNWPSFFLLNTRNFEVVTNSDRYPPLMVGRRSGLLLYRYLAYLQGQTFPIPMISSWRWRPLPKGWLIVDQVMAAQAKPLMSVNKVPRVVEIWFVKRRVGFY